MADENDIALGVAQIAAAQGTGICSFKRAYAEIPDNVKLSASNLRPSDTRPGEPMWHQLVRNIQSHHETPGNFIADGYLEHVPRVGYKLTNAGRQLLRRSGRHP